MCYFDTHCHLNFKAFNKNLPEVIDHAREAGVTAILVPGTDVATSQKGVEIARSQNGVYAAVGIHPHHAYQYQESKVRDQRVEIKNDLGQIEKLLTEKKVVAVGEVGLDYHVYAKTKYEKYAVDEQFRPWQKALFVGQLKLAVKYHKTLILHNREAKADLLPLLVKHWSAELAGRTVFHCCEPDEALLQFAKEKNIFIGVDGDVTYNGRKQEFVKKVPSELLVLETDSPYLLPEPLRSQKAYPCPLTPERSDGRRANEPKNIPLIFRFLREKLGINVAQEQIVENSQKLFDVKVSPYQDLRDQRSKIRY